MTGGSGGLGKRASQPGGWESRRRETSPQWADQPGRLKQLALAEVSSHLHQLHAFVLAGPPTA